MSAYYNEIDPFAAQWLRNLIAKNLIAPGDVDERSIVDVQPDDLLGFAQCHFFAGIGGWSYALRLAGWPDDELVWTGSCPCQPFSVAGKQDGHKDERHLYPEWSRLIKERKPPVIFGEQVEGAIRHGWLDAVQGDLEAEGYAFGTAILGAHSVGAPHIRQRVWFVAESQCRTTERRGLDMGETQGIAEGAAQERERIRNDIRAGVISEFVAHSTQQGRSGGYARMYGGERETESSGTETCLLGNPDDTGLEGRNLVGSGCTGELAPGQAGMAGGILADRNGNGTRTGRGDAGEVRCVQEEKRESEYGSALSRGSGWDDIEWLPCRDGKARPTQPGLFPLADGIPGRVGRLRAYGNAIVPQVAAEFIQAYRECRP